MFKRIFSLLKKTKQKPIEDIVTEFKKTHEITSEPKQNIDWNKSAKFNIDYVFETKEEVYLLVLDPKKAEQKSDYITLNPEYHGQNIYLYTLNNNSLIEIAKHERKKIKKIRIKEKEIDIKLEDVIKKINPNLQEIIQKYFREGKGNNPVVKASNALNEFLLHYLDKEFNSNIGILYNGMPKKEEKKLIGTEKDLIILNSISGRENFLKGIPHFSPIFARASFKDGYYYIKSGIVLNLTTGEYYFSKERDGTYLISGKNKKQIIIKPNHYFQKDTIRVKIFKKQTKISEDYKKEKKQFFDYINYLENLNNPNIQTIKQLSFGLSIMENIENTHIIGASHFPIYNAGVAFLLQGLGFVRLNTMLDQIRLNDLNEKPMLYFQNNSLMQDFKETIRNENTFNIINRLYNRKNTKTFKSE